MTLFPSPKERHPFHMHSMIRGQPGFIRETLDRVDSGDERRLRAPSRHLVLTGCGTSFHAAMYGARVLQAVAVRGEVVEAIPAYDLAYGRMPRNATVFGVSHSGSTSTTNRALARAARAGLRTFGMCGLADSRMEELVDEVLVIGSTHDRSWANTMSYTTQLSAFAALASFRTRSAELTRRGVQALPALVQKALGSEDSVRRLSSRIVRRDRVTFLGTGLDEVTALEAALKIRETAGLTASGYHAEQFLHGPFLSLDRRDSIIFLLAKGDQARAAAIGRALARTGAALTTAGEDPGASIRLPRTQPFLRPVASVVPLQFLAYYAALARHANPDIMRSDIPRFRAGVEALLH
jgi:glutamine---fructose-6-phosphate transaminase (isomerizing)